jgi:hypothetical protein
MEADTVSETSDTNSLLAQLITLEDFIADNFLNSRITIKHPKNTLCYEARWTATQPVRAERIMKPKQT